MCVPAGFVACFADAPDAFRQDTSAMKTMSAPLDALEFFGDCDVFRNLGSGEIRAIAEAATWQELQGREVLLNQGDVADHVVLIYRGALRVLQQGADGTVTVLGEHRRGELVGEAGILAETPRAATLLAIRCSVVAQIGAELFQRLLREHSEIAIRVATHLSKRLIAKNVASSPARFAVVVPLDQFNGSDLHGLVGAIASGSNAETVWLAEHPNLDVAQLETRQRNQVLIGTNIETSLAFCRQVDEVLLVVRAESRINPKSLVELFDIVRGAQGPTCRLVIVHPIDVNRNSSRGKTRELLAVVPSESHHHIRSRWSDAKRVGRLLARTSVSLVLGGGGARGAAHVGVIRALQEAGVPIDHVGGTSMGAIVGGVFCAGYPTSELVSMLEGWYQTGAMRSIAFPSVSLLHHKKTEQKFNEMFGDGSIEDLWTNFLCTTVDITSGLLSVHTNGSAARWIRASGAIPGVFAPVVGEDGNLHVDGGLINNLPSDVMRQIWLGRVIAIDVGSPSAAMKMPANQQGSVGVRYLIDRYRKQPTLPTVGEVMQRGATLSSVQQLQASKDASNVIVTPDLGGFGMFDFANMAKIAARGYEGAINAMPEILAAIR
jgi:NTE family protein